MLLYFFEKGKVPASASIDAYGFLLKLFKHSYLLQFKDQRE
jgi:hypothetical protein